MALPYHTIPYHTLVNHGNYIKAVLDRNLAENISRVLYPNDNVCAHTTIVNNLALMVTGV